MRRDLVCPYCSARYAHPDDALDHMEREHGVTVTDDQRWDYYAWWRTQADL
jgi:hypothetical protein